jgi:hypothetical protein
VEAEEIFHCSAASSLFGVTLPLKKSITDPIGLTGFSRQKNRIDASGLLFGGKIH